MNKIQLKFKGINEIMEGEKLGLIILTDVASTRQISIVCDKYMEYDLGMRIGKAPILKKMLPEVMCKLMPEMNRNNYEVLIVDIVKGEYKAVVVDKMTLDMTSIRVSDGILLAVVAGLDIFIEERLMARQSVPFVKGAHGMNIPVNSLSESMLRDALDKAVEQENYELASQIKNEIDRRKKAKE